MTALTQIGIEAIRANTYNPNTMTPAEFAELVAEVRHLGRLPKPIVVRPNGAGYIIVDGEHGWRAAKENTIALLDCEVVDVDDFESMRQTYKRNQHGTQNPVRLGQMFAAMMRERTLSQRALAKEVEVSEGTIRNALAYADAAGLRNGYAFEGLGIRQIREYLALPAPIRDYWLDAGADPEILNKSLTGINGWDAKGKAEKQDLEETWWDGLVKEGFAVALDPGEGYELTAVGFIAEARRAFDLLMWSYHMARRVDGAHDFAIAAARALAPASILGKLPVKPDKPKWRSLVTVAQWDEILQRCAARKPKTEDDWAALVRACLDLALREAGIDRDYTDPRTLLTLEYLKSAPDFIRDADIDLADRVFLADAVAEVPKDILLEAKREAVRMMISRQGWLTGNTSILENAGIPVSDIEEMRKKALAFTVAQVFSDALEEKLRDWKLSKRNALYADDAALLDRTLEHATRLYVIRAGVVQSRPAPEVMRERLAALPNAERRLLCMLLLGEQDCWASVWLSSAGGTCTDPCEGADEAAREVPA